jgi:hypothetical protein
MPSEGQQEAVPLEVWVSKVRVRLSEPVEGMRPHLTRVIHESGVPRPLRRKVIEALKRPPQS